MKYTIYKLHLLLLVLPFVLGRKSLVLTFIKVLLCSGFRNARVVKFVIRARAFPEFPCHIFPTVYRVGGGGDGEFLIMRMQVILGATPL